LATSSSTSSDPTRRWPASPNDGSLAFCNAHFVTG
jgi:hypothetical protein